MESDSRTLTENPIKMVVLIPAYKPSDKLLEIIGLLTADHDIHVVVVDDGSGPEFAGIFERSRRQLNTTVLVNAINLGKGAALKHGFNYILAHGPNDAAIITADADGQHASTDIRKVAELTRLEPASLVMGSRSFTGDVPLRSRIGNGISKWVYRALIGLKIDDTQTGLRGIPRSLAEASLSIRSNRYEFETEQLITASNLGIKIASVPIRTIYEDGNSSSHFNPIFDSLKIYFSLVRYAFSSILTTLIDLLCFIALLPITNNLMAANIGSRTVALFFQFILLQKFVFKTKNGLKTFVAFVAYVMFTGFVSAATQEQITLHLGVGHIYSKIFVETTIFFLNFLFMRDVLFRKNNDR